MEPPPLAELLDRYIDACAARGLAPQTLVERRGYVRHFFEWLGIRDLGALTSENVRAYSNELAALRLAPHTQAQRLWIVVDLLEWLVECRLIFANPASGICPNSFPKRIPAESEMTRLLAIPNTRTSVGRRDRAIVELMYSTGLRVGELASLDVSDLDLTAGTLTVRCGKGGKARVVPLGDVAVAALLDYLHRSRPGFVQTTPEPAALFLASDQSARAGNRLTTYAIRAIVHRIARKAGCPINPYQFRYACATHMLHAGASLRGIQQLLGHAPIGTTEMKKLHRLYHPRERLRAASR